MSENKVMKDKIRMSNVYFNRLQKIKKECWKESWQY